MPLSRLQSGDSRVAADYRAHYEIIDVDLRSYILSTDSKAWHHFLCGINVCPFCSTEVTTSRSCCRRFSELRESTAAEAGQKDRGQKVEKFKVGKSSGKKYDVTEEARRKAKSCLSTRFA